MSLTLNNIFSLYGLYGQWDPGQKIKQGNLSGFSLRFSLLYAITEKALESEDSKKSECHFCVQVKNIFIRLI